MPTENDPRDENRRGDDLLSTLANRHCRFVPGYFMEASEDVASVEELSTAFARESSRSDGTEVAKRFHHVALPKLAAEGVVDYDARSKTVRYRGHSRLDDWDARGVESDSDRPEKGE